MARAAVERSAGGCESFSGHVDADVLVYLANRHVLPRNQPKVSILVQQDQDCQDGRTEVIVEPTAASRPEAFRGQRPL